jgi:hypothetical protein
MRRMSGPQALRPSLTAVERGVLMFKKKPERLTRARRADTVFAQSALFQRKGRHV